MPKVKPLTEAQRLKQEAEKEQAALERDRAEFAKALRIALIESGSDRQTVCRKSGISEQTWRRCLHTPDNLTLGQLRRLYKVLPIPTSVILNIIGAADK